MTDTKAEAATTASSTPGDFGLSQIGQISIVVHDLEKATRFYRDVLGMQFLFSAPPQMSFFDCGGIRLMVGLPSEAALDHPASVIYYKVGDIEEAHRTLVARGVEFERDPQLAHKADGYELWLAFLRDPDHNLLALMSEKGAVGA